MYMYITDNDDGRICKYSFFYTEDYMYIRRKTIPKNNVRMVCERSVFILPTSCSYNILYCRPSVNKFPGHAFKNA